MGRVSSHTLLTVWLIQAPPWAPKRFFATFGRFHVVLGDINVLRTASPRLFPPTFGAEESFRDDIYLSYAVLGWSVPLFLRVSVYSLRLF